MMGAQDSATGTRQNIDEFTETTAKALEVVGGARQGKAIIILNPADPPIMMRNTVYVIPEGEFGPLDKMFFSSYNMCVNTHIH